MRKNSNHIKIEYNKLTQTVFKNRHNLIVMVSYREFDKQLATVNNEKRKNKRVKN